MANLTAKIVVRYRNEQGQRKWIEANGKTDPQGTYYLQFYDLRREIRHRSSPLSVQY